MAKLRWKKFEDEKPKHGEVVLVDMEYFDGSFKVCETHTHKNNETYLYHGNGCGDVVSRGLWIYFDDILDMIER